MDPVAEQMTPINTWGVNYAVSPTPNINRDEEYVIVAALDNTQVVITDDRLREEVSLCVRGSVTCHVTVFDMSQPAVACHR